MSKIWICGICLGILWLFDYIHWLAVELLLMLLRKPRFGNIQYPHVDLLIQAKTFPEMYKHQEIDGTWMRVGGFLKGLLKVLCCPLATCTWSTSCLQVVVATQLETGCCCQLVNSEQEVVEVIKCFTKAIMDKPSKCVCVFVCVRESVCVCMCTVRCTNVCVSDSAFGYVCCFV